TCLIGAWLHASRHTARPMNTANQPSADPFARVVTTYSQRMRLQLSDNQTVDARIKGKQLRPVCGDWVRAQPIPGEDEWLITAIQDRANELSRPNVRGHAEILAANIDLLLATTSATPRPDWYVIDRYLAAAELMKTRAAVIFNKVDLYDDEPAVERILDNYSSLNYPVLRCSASDGSGVVAIGSLLDHQVAIIVGQSGVGKSSIINALLGSEHLRTAAISTKRDEGRHTTVNSTMLRLPDGGSIIDSPGVRDFAPAMPSLAAVGRGFREIADAAAACRFANCRHTREPGCAVKDAAENGRISQRRYDSYKRLLNLTQGFLQQR
ncbi:MAG: ribosome small subunit-dependent GTPase A, partial [Gammaproteobacteria bacterium]|nr:ribosome small subunit-dependent GTPase A [Gammaproteobacteria bacterium]